MGERGRPGRHGPGLAGELKAAAREALHLGARYAEAGRTWLNERTTMMNQRPHEPRHESPRHDGDHERQPTSSHVRDRHRDDYDQPRASGRGGYGPEYRGSEYGDTGGPGRQQHFRDSGWQPAGRGYRADQQGREYGQGGYPRPRHEDEYERSGEHGYGEHPGNAPRAILGADAGRRASSADTYQSDYTDWRRGPGRNQEGERGYSGFHGQERHDLDEPGLGVGRYGGRRQLETAGFGYDEDYPRRSELYGRGYGAGSGYTSPYENPQRSRHGDAGSLAGTAGHRGRGPRQYTRSDERILEDVCERLTDDDHVDASDITVRVDSGMVTLSGEVEERWMKHRAEDIADACPGVRQVENRIRVHGGSASAGSYATRGHASGNGNTVRSEDAGSGSTAAGATPSSGSQTH